MPSEVDFGVSIAGNPVLVDCFEEAQQWLDANYSDSEMFFSNDIELDSSFSGQSNSIGDWFRSSLPKLPPIKIGQFQWPCVGVSRFARSLFLVDRYSLFSILNTAWGITVPGTGEIPASWGQTRNSSVDVRFVSAEDDFSIKMFCLLPIRITDDVWILRLVDGRYEKRDQVIPRAYNVVSEDSPNVSWGVFFTSVNGAIGYDVYYVLESAIGGKFGNPDIAFSTTTTPASLLIDSACFSNGCRPVCTMDSTESAVKVRCEQTTDAITKRTTLLGKDRITGGTANAANKPNSLIVDGRLSEDFYVGNNRTRKIEKTITGGKGRKLCAKALWLSFDSNGSSHGGSVTPFSDYVETVASKVAIWNADEYWVTLQGYATLVPSGFDDCITYDTRLGITIVKSMPIEFFPPYLTAQIAASTENTSATVDCPWWFTLRDTVSGIALAASGIGGKDLTKGLTKKTIIDVQIVDPSLRFGTGTGLAKTVVPSLVLQKDSIPSGSIVQMSWIRTVVVEGTGDLANFEGWAIDWVDC